MPNTRSPPPISFCAYVPPPRAVDVLYAAADVRKA